MADRKVTAMTLTATPVDADVVYLVRPGDGDPDRKTTVALLRKALDIKGGGNQKITIINNIITTDDTPEELLDEDGNRITIEDDTSMAFELLLAARRTDADGESAGFKIWGVLHRNAGTVTMVAVGPDFTLAGSWTVTCSADDTNKALAIFLTGEVGKTIKWNGILTYVKVTG